MERSPGLTNRDGVLFKDGAPYFGYGVNYYSLFTAALLSGENYRAGIDTLSEHRIPCARFNCGVYYPKEVDALDTPAAFRLLTEIAGYAEKRNVGLLPSFFWNCMCLPDRFDEPLGDWGREDSATRAYMRRYTERAVKALAGFSSVWGWEFGNEFNLNVDLPNRMENVPPLPPGSKRSRRDGSDQLTTTGLISALAEFSALAKALDSAGRIVSSGNADLRPSQYNQAAELTFRHDTEEEHDKILAALHPGGTDCVSEHIYFSEHDYFKAPRYPVEAHLTRTVRLTRTLKKAYLVGEFGDCGIAGDSPHYGYRAMCEKMRRAGVQLAFAWNYDPTERTEFSFGGDSEKQRYLFAALDEANRKGRKIMKKGGVL